MDVPFDVPRDGPPNYYLALFVPEFRTHHASRLQITFAAIATRHLLALAFAASLARVGRRKNAEMAHLIVRAISIVVVLISAGWLYAEPHFEPLITTLMGAAGIVSSYPLQASTKWSPNGAARSASSVGVNSSQLNSSVLPPP